MSEVKMTEEQARYILDLFDGPKAHLKSEHSGVMAQDYHKAKGFIAGIEHERERAKEAEEPCSECKERDEEIARLRSLASQCLDERAKLIQEAKR